MSIPPFGIPKVLLWTEPRWEDPVPKGIGSLGGETWLVLVTQDSVWQWELDIGIVEQLDSQPAPLCDCNLFCPHLDQMGPGAVLSAHVSVYRKEKKSSS
jgi:hypothetical protein